MIFILRNVEIEIDVEFVSSLYCSVDVNNFQLIK